MRTSEAELAKHKFKVNLDRVLDKYFMDEFSALKSAGDGAGGEGGDADEDGDGEGGSP